MTTKYDQIHDQFAFYGTLREGHGNYNHLVAPAPGMKYEGTIILPGYKMFDIGYGAYPFITPSDDNTDNITVELYYMPDPKYARSIHNMEVGAGYDVQALELNNKTYWIYVKEKGRGAGYREVPGGDWTAYKKEFSKRVKA